MAQYILFQFMRGSVLFILWYMVIMNGAGILQMVFAFIIAPGYFSGTRRSNTRLTGSSENMIPISVLVPAFNEEAAIVGCIKAMLNLTYANYEIIVINDGSTDSTLNTVIGSFGLHKITYPVRERLAVKKVRGVYYSPDVPRLLLIDKEAGGKSDALNAGINFSRCPYFISIDTKTILEEEALPRIAAAFMENKYTVAAGGMIRAVNGCRIENGKIIKYRLPRKPLALFQIIEYLHSFMVSRMGWGSLNSLLIISGAFGAFQKEPVLQVGGYTTGTVGEDTDLVIKLHRYMHAKNYKYRISFMPEPLCWTKVPEDLDSLYRQRRQRQERLIDVLGRCRDMFLNRRFGIIGMLAVPYYYLFELISPIIELAGYVLIPLAWYFGILSPDALGLFFAAVFIFGMVSSVGSLVIESFTNTKYLSVGASAFLNLLCVAENLFYRQITVFFRLVGIFSYRKQKRGTVKRHQPTE